MNAWRFCNTKFKKKNFKTPTPNKIDKSKDFQVPKAKTHKTKRTIFVTETTNPKAAEQKEADPKTPHIHQPRPHRQILNTSVISQDRRETPQRHPKTPWLKVLGPLSSAAAKEKEREKLGVAANHWWAVTDLMRGWAMSKSGFFLSWVWSCKGKEL